MVNTCVSTTILNSITNLSNIIGTAGANASGIPDHHIDITGSGSGSVLPIELQSFEGIYKDNAVRLTWVTATEIENDKFIIEKSVDGSFFEPIGEIEGAGNSIELLRYTFEDEFPDSEVNYYRLKSVDFDGSSEYSEIISVSGVPELSFRIMPNPTQGVLHISGDQPEQSVVEIFDISGVLKRREELLVGQVDISDFPDGLYFLKITSGRKTWTEKVLKN